jgi:RNA polymerase sigma-70 factor (ECF subfamily)
MELGKQLEIIVLRCQNGDTDAFEELFELYQPRLKYYIRRLDATGANTDDTLQDIWLTVFRKIHKLKDARSFPIWLYRIARNRVYGRFRRKQKFARLPEEEHLPELGYDEPVFDADDAERLYKALNNIQPHHKEVITLCFLEQLSYQAIAEIVGCSLGTIKSRIYYAKQSLRKELESKNE